MDGPNTRLGLMHDDKIVGKITDCLFSASRQNIALAIVNINYSNLNQKLIVVMVIMNLMQWL